ncbi:protein-L-isoaspartate O-methyltransferase [Rhodopseudomonas sp. AAP120]|jgi:protein-L-isoaspartate(D-aspartate) O-methyltransferase|uniref:protein-L-isoaspartate(D-aspartate) O-methyltransferase n=1 Tax=Rhodopseudomonas sp. AAP120 TaxID=1523430 RepID=UPI0006B8B64D|nr:protein-L-isoaspartate(D-aspartate) O-methyltransferase [Rhodopseudomonas sp. AAP120]KPF96663.1 protein-L-isoaspartate O-methyltransferase [Rhodopseudomonas sp. AAP120]
MASPESRHSSGRAPASDFAAQRARMVEQQIRARGVSDPLVLAAIAKVPREAFVPNLTRAHAYDDSPLPIGGDQTISQPYIVAVMIAALQLEGGERVLEVGTGSGYAAAVLAAIAGDVISIERLEPLADRARTALAALGIRNVEVRHGDGSRGCPERAPFAAIVVAAGGPRVPDSLKAQLAIGGRLVMPVGADQLGQKLLRVTRRSDSDYFVETLTDVRFVPLIGAEGWDAADRDAALPRTGRT